MGQTTSDATISQPKSLRRIGNKKILFFLSSLFVVLSIMVTLLQIKPNPVYAASTVQTITFDDLPVGEISGKYPQGLIQWGNGIWSVNEPWGLFTTNSLIFTDNIKTTSFTFLQPRRLVSLDAFNGGGSKTTTVTLACAGQPSVTVSVAAEKTAHITTNWTANCATVSITSNNSWNTSFDNLAVDNASATPTPTSTPILTPTPNPSGIWKPALTTSWQWQLAGTVDQSVNAQMFDIDGFDNSASVVASLHSQQKKVVCYISAGTYENWRSDASQFPASVKGNDVDEWNEQWLDIRNLTVLAPIMGARLDMCKAKGFDSVEPDNIDGYTNDTGFPLTAQDQITYNKWLASEAHTRGLSIALKNDSDQINSLLPYFDWALNEQCFQYNECSGYAAFISAGKAVMQVEYSSQPSQFCPQANSMNFNALKKNPELDSFRIACR